MTDKDQDASKLPWLGRESRAANFSSIITSLSKAHVISIEAGFGYGKTIFAKKWAAQLREQDETVIIFDAWEADHTDDPLLAFTAKLMTHLPPSTQNSLAEYDRSNKALKGLGNIVKLSSIALAKQAAGTYGANVVAEYFEAEEDSDEKKLIEKVAEAAGKETSKQLTTFLGAQFVKEKIRATDLPKELQALRHELDLKNKGRIIVIIDELDRCRPDFAIAMLEAIKHLFNEEGYIFVLMINPEQIERTAGRLFGKIEGGEPYFAKFVDLRLELGLPAYDELTKHLFEPLDDKFTPITESPDFRFPKAAEWMSKFAETLAATPRQIESTMRHTEIAMALAHGKKIDPVYLFCALLLKTLSRKEDDTDQLINKHIPWIGFSVTIGDLLDATQNNAMELPRPQGDQYYKSKILSFHDDLRKNGLPLIGKGVETDIIGSTHNARTTNLETASRTSEYYKTFLPSLINTSIEIQAT